jgi:hypothetical protein
MTLGMEDNLLEIFGGHDIKEVITKGISAESGLNWTKDGQAEFIGDKLRKRGNCQGWYL